MALYRGHKPRPCPPVSARSRADLSIGQGTPRGVHGNSRIGDASPDVRCPCRCVRCCGRPIRGTADLATSVALRLCLVRVAGVIRRSHTVGSSEVAQVASHRGQGDTIPHSGDLANIGANLYVRIGRRPCGGAAAVRLVARAARLSQRTELAEHMFGGAAAGPNLTKPTNLVLFLFRSESSG